VKHRDAAVGPLDIGVTPDGPLALAYRMGAGNRLNTMVRYSLISTSTMLPRGLRCLMGASDCGSLCSATTVTLIIAINEGVDDNTAKRSAHLSNISFDSI
jgi:hypothetical protein